MTRHLDTGSSLLSFSDEIFVLCPNCQSSAKVITDKSCKAKFTCPKCALSFNNKVDSWQGNIKLYGKRPCRLCGHKWVKVSRNYPKRQINMPTQQNATCPACKTVSVIDCEWLPIIPADHAVDPFFGLPLALKTNCKRNVIWVYNANHLREYREFISADLRERKGVSKWSWFVRLPNWIKSAKNREHVLKALNRIEVTGLDSLTE